MDTERVRITSSTVADGKPVQAGDEPTVSSRAARILIALGKAVAIMEQISDVETTAPRKSRRRSGR